MQLTNQEHLNLHQLNQLYSSIYPLQKDQIIHNNFDLFLSKHKSFLKYIIPILIQENHQYSLSLDNLSSARIATLIKISYNAGFIDSKFLFPKTQLPEFFDFQTQVLLSYLHLDFQDIIYNLWSFDSINSQYHFFIVLSNLKLYPDTNSINLNYTRTNLSKRLNRKLKFGTTDKYWDLKQRIINLYQTQYSLQTHLNPFLTSWDQPFIINVFPTN